MNCIVSLAFRSPLVISIDMFLSEHAHDGLA